MNDFADWLSPILVKELRQGLRTKAFVGIFVLLQILMVISTMIELANDRSNGSQVFFWMVIGVALLLGMPLRGAFSISNEIKENTLELVLLTELSARRVALGKWVALFLQSVLLVCTVLPYLVIRYFMGGVDFIQGVVALAVFLWFSALLTALSVGLSPFAKNAISRGAVGIFAVMAIWFLLLSSLSLGRLPFGSFFSAAHVIILAALTPLFLLGALEIGLGEIAPMGENQSTRKRLILLGNLAVGGVLALVFEENAYVAWILAGCVAMVGIGTLVEPCRPIPSLYRPVWPFRRSSRLWRAAGRILYPGWVSAVPFLLVSAAAVLAISPYRFTDSEQNLRLILAIGMALQPLVICKLMSSHRPTLPVYMAIQIALFVMSIVLAGAFDRSTNLSLAGLLPTTGFFLSLWRSNLLTDSSGINVLAGVALLFTLLGYVSLSIREWVTMAEMERRIAEENPAIQNATDSGEAA